MKRIFIYLATKHPSLLFGLVLLLTMALALVLPFLAVTGFPQ